MNLDLFLSLHKDDQLKVFSEIDNFIEYCSDMHDFDCDYLNNTLTPIGQKPIYHKCDCRFPKILKRIEQIWK